MLSRGKRGGRIIRLYYNAVLPRSSHLATARVAAATTRPRKAATYCETLRGTFTDGPAHGFKATSSPAVALGRAGISGDDPGSAPRTRTCSEAEALLLPIANPVLVCRDTASVETPAQRARRPFKQEYHGGCSAARRPQSPRLAIGNIPRAQVTLTVSTPRAPPTVRLLRDCPRRPFPGSAAATLVQGPDSALARCSVLCARL